MNTAKRKVLFISSWYPNRTKPTFGIFVKRHAQAVALHNDVSAVYVTSDAGLKDKVYDIVENTEEGIYTVRVYYQKVTSRIPFLSSFTKLRRYLQAYRMGLELVMKKKGRPDIVHANMLFPAGIIALRIKKKYSIPYIVTENWTGYLPSDGSYKGSMLKMMTKRIANGASYLTPVSEDLKAAMIHHGFSGPYEIVPNVVNVHVFQPQENKKQNDKIRLVHVSVLDDAQKNVSGMLRAMQKASQERNDIELQIVGDGEYRAQLEKYAGDLGILNKSVFFLGLKFQEELSQLLRQADAFVLFSNYENLPCVVIEALASGIPVIATRIGGTPEHITPDLGIIVEPKDEAALEAAILKMADTHKQYDRARLRSYAVDHFSYEKVGEQFNNIYNKVLSGHAE